MNLASDLLTLTLNIIAAPYKGFATYLLRLRNSAHTNFRFIVNTLQFTVYRDHV